VRADFRLEPTGSALRRDDPEETFLEWGDFSVAQATDAKPTTRRLHTGFFAASRAAVDAFWQAGIDAGYRDDYCSAFLLDPDGNSVELVDHNR